MSIKSIVFSTYARVGAFLFAVLGFVGLAKAQVTGTYEAYDASTTNDFMGTTVTFFYNAMVGYVTTLLQTTAGKMLVIALILASFWFVWKVLVGRHKGG